MEIEEGYFVITRVHRNDLEEIGYDASNVDDATMINLANIMEEIYCETRFWGDLDTTASSLGIPEKISQDTKNIELGGE